MVWTIVFKNKIGITVILSLFLHAFFWVESSANNLPDCEELARKVELETGLPKNILVSISIVEAGRYMEDGTKIAWPWALNHAGKSLFFESRKSALNYLYANITPRFRNIDVGCMQISVKWHFDQFKTFEQMINPVENIRYAASFLTDLKKIHGSWDKAIKHYHSATTKLNKIYFAKVSDAWSQLDERTLAEIPKKVNFNLIDQNTSFSNNRNVVEFNGRVNLPKENDGNIYYKSSDYAKGIFDASFINEKSDTDEIVYNRLRISSDYLRKNFDKIVMFRNEFARID